MSSASIPCTSPVSLLLPPYDQPHAISPAWRPRDWPIPGAVLIWSLLSAHALAEFDFVKHRLPGLPLVLVLPPPDQLDSVRALLARFSELRPRAILPASPLIRPEVIRTLLTRHRRPMAEELHDYLQLRGLLPDRIRAEVSAMFEVATYVRSVTQLCRKLYTSRRTLGRHFEAEQVPPPSHWLQMARLVHVSARLQREKLAVFRVAIQAGYPDGFTMSNQMKRLLGCRPTDVRDAPGWEWVVESWIRSEVTRGGFDLERYRTALRPYAAGDTPRS